MGYNNYYQREAYKITNKLIPPTCPLVDAAIKKMEEIREENMKLREAWKETYVEKLELESKVEELENRIKELQEQATNE